MECQENGGTMWWKPRALFEITIIELGREGENWNDPCPVFQIPPRGGVGRTCGVVALLSFLTSSIVRIV